MATLSLTVDSRRVRQAEVDGHEIMEWEGDASTSPPVADIYEGDGDVDDDTPVVSITELDPDVGFSVWCNRCDRQLGVYERIEDADAMQAAHERHHA